MPELEQRLLALPGARAAVPAMLRNRYFDTPDGRLNRERMALRVRQANGQCIQTLKTKGRMQGGVAHRQEWEWAIDSPELRLDLLADTPLADHGLLEQLQPCFETSFERRVIDLEFSGEAGDNRASIECALDQGEVIAGDRKHPLCELEIELKEGDARALSLVARKLADEVPMFLNGVSKAEQGYDLAGLHRFPEPPSAPVERCLSVLAEAWQRNEHGYWSGVLDALEGLRDQADRHGMNDTLNAIKTRFREASEQGRAPREVLTTDRDLARLQLTVAMG